MKIRRSADEPHSFVDSESPPISRGLGFSMTKSINGRFFFFFFPNFRAVGSNVVSVRYHDVEGCLRGFEAKEISSEPRLDPKVTM